MPIKVLVIDDSSFFRRRLSDALNSSDDIEVIDVAINGEEGVNKAIALKPDVITMDIEMPIMNGITAVREIMVKQPTPILMFSSLTEEGAAATLESLEAGAVDYLPKRFEEISKDFTAVAKVICEKVKIVSRAHVRRIEKSASIALSQRAASTTEVKRTPVTTSRAKKGKFDLVAIGTSTGGPIALQKVLTGLPQDFPVPIILVQHMPGTFTGNFANRLDHVCDISVKEAVDGEQLQPGMVYLAPGGRQMSIKSNKIRIYDGDEKLHYKPSVDEALQSLVSETGGKTLVIILTGMGSDGCSGATALKEKGATVWAQDEETCVVFGMPAAIVKAGIADMVLPLDKISAQILKEV